MITNKEKKVPNSKSNEFKSNSLKNKFWGNFGNLQHLRSGSKHPKYFSNESQGAIKVNVHYCRPENDYDGWNIWFWNKETNGRQANFENQDLYGKVASFYTNIKGNSVGFNVRKNGWQERDHGDRYFTVDRVNQKGEMDIYLYQGEHKIAFDPKEFEYKKRQSSLNPLEMGVNYEGGRTSFRLFSPDANEAEVVLYKDGLGGGAIKTIPMKREPEGTWNVEVSEDLKNKFYTYRVKVHGRVNEAVDPYATAVGANGVRGQIVDLKETNPLGWEKDKGPSLVRPTDAVIYETHVRNFTIDQNSGVSNKGKYLGMVESGTKNRSGLSTGIDHLKELGITHVQLMPTYDFGSIDETNPNQDRGNWGYDPVNWNAPEGSYSNNPYDGKVRVKEFKEMVKGFHDKGIGVIVDVVFPHTLKGYDSNLNLLAPDYYYRKQPDGKWANATGCGNEVASEKEWASKLIVETMLHWAKEYHVDGFRMDQMGILDRDTVMTARKELNKINPKILMYGEGWDVSHVLQKENASRSSIMNMKGVGFFNNMFAASVKGDFNNDDSGVAQGDIGRQWRMKWAIKGDTYEPEHGQPEKTSPSQMINYVGCHDNLTFWDKIDKTVHDSFESKVKAYKIGFGLLMTSQGIPLLSEGDEFIRPKHQNNNSYNAPDYVNKIDWEAKTRNREVNEYIRGLIELRKNHPAFRMNSTHEIHSKLNYIQHPDERVIAYTLDGHANNDPIEKFAVLVNPGNYHQNFNLPQCGSSWSVLVNDRQAGNKEIGRVDNNHVTLPPRSFMVLADTKSLRNMEIRQIRNKMLGTNRRSKEISLNK